jgi:catechol 2,3-dioxygenase-like lactoylglutathione lyase family enzyme
MGEGFDSFTEEMTQMEHRMARFTGICIITKDVERLGDFYREILQAGYDREGDNLTFQIEGALLSIFSHQGTDRMVPGSMDGAGYGSYTIEFEVEDVDLEFERLKGLGVTCVKPPITYPWGRRSAWFRDPDGNLVNFFQPATPEHPGVS